MKQLTLTKIFTFDAAHHLDNYIGPCSEIHGHTYKLEVTISGPMISDMIIDFSEVKKIVEENIISKLDHRYINKIVSFNPTVENLALWIAETLESKLDNPIQLKKIRLWENQSAYAEVTC
ncbi:MAG: 6-carboxytetrahydropterin synthase QueD [Syntrophomonadaceae bacterium]|jgi:6-pyruvoyltetrahydropterin/6-carboxytetrahydropterin synthase